MEEKYGKRKIKRVEQKMSDQEIKEKFLRAYGQLDITFPQTCEEIGTDESLIQHFRKKDPVFEDAIRKTARKKRQIRMKKLGKSNTGDATRGQIKRRKDRQGAFLKAFRRSSFNITTACREIGVTRPTFNHWKTNYPEFKAAYENILEEKKDFVEGKLMENIGAGDSQCIMFTCRTQLKDRGYVEKQEVEHSGSFGVMVVPGNVKNLEQWEKAAAKQQQSLREKTMDSEHTRELIGE